MAILAVFVPGLARMLEAHMQTHDFAIACRPPTEARRVFTDSCWLPFPTNCEDGIGLILYLELAVVVLQGFIGELSIRGHGTATASPPARKAAPISNHTIIRHRGCLA